MNRRNFLLNTAYIGGFLALGQRSFAADDTPQAFELPGLPYSHDALAPHIDTQTMQIHHGKHHAGYTRKFNAALTASDSFKGASIEKILSGISTIKDTKLMKAFRHNAGGYYNHKLFWEIMAPADSTGKPSAALDKAIVSAFGSMQQFQEIFTTAGATQFGSGWAWLIVQNGKLKVTSTPIQDNPLMNGIVPEGDLGTPILGVDVWEHAYYLKYKNQRGSYLKEWWNVVNWNKVSENFDKA